MLKFIKGKKSSILYLDSVIKSPEQTARLNDFKNIFKSKSKDFKLKFINVDQEFDIKKTDSIVKAILSFKPDIICGYVHEDWYELIEQVSNKQVSIYSLLIDSKKPGFIVDSHKWMKEILPDIYLRLDNRKITSQPKPYTAVFVK